MPKKTQMPKTEDEYSVKFVFSEQEQNLNEIIKNCFEIQLNNLTNCQKSL